MREARVSPLAEIYVYGLRDISEKQYSILKSQLNGDTTRSHTDQGIKSRLAVCFIASIIRTEIELACKALDLDTNVMIRKLDRAYFAYMPNGTYQAVYNCGKSLNLEFATEEARSPGRAFFLMPAVGRFSARVSRSNNYTQTVNKSIFCL